ncbi:MAG: hypothetical protein ACP5FL_07885 [Thermoplasmatota archaeon]
MATVDEILEEQREEGRRIIERSATSRELFEELRRECPHVPEEEIVRLFKSVAAGTKMVDSAIVAAAHNMEYNATHPVSNERPWIDIYFTDTARDIMSPEELMKDKDLYHDYIEMISSLEANYDGKAEMPDLAIFRRQTTVFLKDRIE